MALKTHLYNALSFLPKLLVGLFVFSPFFLSSQSLEDCNNGLDDDGDGLIDCFDTDCTCMGQCDSFYYKTCNPACSYLPPCGPVSLKAKWTSDAETGTYSPLVAGDMDADGIPDVVTTRVEAPDLYILDGATGLTKVHVVNPNTFWPGGTAAAIADLDHDGFGEIVIVGEDRKLYCYNHDGSVKFVGPTLVGYDYRYRYAVPNIADFDNNGWPEINIGNQVFNGQTGALLASGSTFLSDGEHPARVAIGFSFASPVPADVFPTAACFGCQGLEIVAGNQVLSVNLNTGIVLPVASAPPAYSDGFTSVADFDGDGDLDAIVQGQKNGQNTVYVWDIATSTVIREFQLLNNWSEGASRVNVADLDGDGKLDISFVGHPWIYALKNDFTPLWILPNNDPSSITCTSVFDFCGDGTSDVVYRNEQKLQIIDGATGNITWQDDCLSFTHIENPLVLDVDADGKTEILIECGSNGSLYSGTVIAFEATGTPPISTRKVWNQHAYYNTNINDDLSVPQYQQMQHIVGDKLKLNSFMNQYTNPTFPSPDATLSLLQAPFCDRDSLELVVSICNNGDNDFPASTPISAYIGNPQTTAATWAGIVASSAAVPRGQCDTMVIRIPRIANDTVFLLLNDNHSLAPPFNLDTDFPVTGIGECAFSNNIVSFYLPYLPHTVDLGQDTALCQLSTRLLDASGLDLVQWQWQDGSTDSVFTAQGPGVYAVTVTDVCLNTQTDSIQVSLYTGTSVDLGQDQSVCPGDSATLNAPGFDLYSWSAGAGAICPNCPSVTITPSGPTQVVLEAGYNYGCFARDTVMLSLYPTYQKTVDTTICYGSAVVWNGQSIEPDSNKTFHLQTINGCDSIVLVKVHGTGVGTFNITFDTAVCLGKSLNINNTVIDPSEEMTFHLMTITGCDSTVLVRVAPKDTFYLTETRTICYGDSLTIFGQPQTTSGMYTGKFSAANGCDSTYVVQLQVLPQLEIEVAGTPACFGQTDGMLTASVPNGVAPLSYNWNVGGQNAAQVTHLPMGDYKVTVTDGNNCTETKTFSLSEYPRSLFIATADSVKCFGESNGAIHIQTTDQSLVFQFEGGSFDQTYSYPNLSAGQYEVVSEDAYGCQDTVSLDVLQPQPFTVALPLDTSIQLGVSLPLPINWTGLPPVQWHWSDTSYLSCLNCPNPVVQVPLQTVRYHLSVENENGCEASDEIVIQVEQTVNVYIPNAMGGDGDNAIFSMGFNPAIKKVRLFRIFDRWGELLHEATNALPDDSSLNWDGTFRGARVGPGVYLWQIELELVDGRIINKIGDLTVIR